MNLKDIRQKKEYGFLQKLNPLFYTFGGSIAYGTSNENSDIDIRGAVYMPESAVFGLTPLEQFEDRETDTVLYGLNKLMKLLSECNPNTIEILGCKEYFATADGKMIIDNSKIFLSRLAIKSFGGYATAQLRRLKNALARDRLSETEKNKYICQTCNDVISGFEDRYRSFGENSSINFSSQEDGRIICNATINNMLVGEFQHMSSELVGVVRSYDFLAKRNRKKDDTHLDKHAMHLLRLYYMLTDILEKQEINTYRKNERELLLSVRNGKFRNSDGTYRDEFFELVDGLEARAKYAGENTDLPEKPDFKRIEEMTMEINRKKPDTNLLYLSR